MEKKKTHWKKQFNYDYLGSYSLEDGQDLTVTITKTDHVLVKSAQAPKGEKCFVAYFKEVDKPMILNPTNCKVIEKLYSKFIEDWPGCKIQLYVTQVSAFGTMTEALRIRDAKPVDNNIDNRDALLQLKACKTLADLQTTYARLSIPLKANQAVKDLKDTLKTELV